MMNSEEKLFCNFSTIRKNANLMVKPLIKSNFLKVYPQVKFLGIIFHSQLTFTKHFEDILDRCNTRYHRLKLLANKKWGPSPSTLIQIYKQCVRPIFDTALFRPLSPQSISSAKFNGSKTNLFGLPFVYQNTSVLSCSMTPLAFHM